MFSVSSVKLGYLSVELSQCLFSQLIVRGAAVPFDGVFHIRNILALYGVCDYSSRSALAVFGCRNGCLDLINIVTVYDDNIPNEGFELFIERPRRRSTNTVRLSSFLFPANIAASQTCPSSDSPSPIMLYTRQFPPKCFDESAIPAAAEMP